MRVAHFAEFAPHKSGLYGTTRDLIMAECSVGIDAVFIDAHLTKEKKVISRPNLKDGDLKIVSPDEALKADIFVHHSIIHPALMKKGIPIVLAIHGRPESTFLMEHRRIMAIFGATMLHGKDHRYKAFFTFWKEYVYNLSLMLPPEKLSYIPAMVDLHEYSPIGNKHKFKGKPNLLVVDMWRQDTTPYNVIIAASRFRDKYCPTAKIHILGAAPKKSSMKALLKAVKNSIGEVHPLVESTALCYRGADMVITPHSIATRVVRESLACGIPIVAGTSSPYTKFTADPKNVDAYADAINECWNYIRQTDKDIVIGEARKIAEDNFNPNVSGEAIKKLFEKVLADEKARWFEQDGLQRKRYPNYGVYLNEQKSKLSGIEESLKKYDVVYRRELSERLSKLPFVKKGKSVLCLGARIGTEVKSFLDAGCFATGIDINPGANNKYVVTGDFHELQYPDNSVDIIFTNSMDHVYRIRTFLAEVRRVLKPDGHFIIEIEEKEDKEKLGLRAVDGSDRWACLWWDNYKDLLDLFHKFNLDMIRKSTIKSLYFKEQICFSGEVITRTDIINRLIEKNGYKKYLEIGVKKGETFNKIICDMKVGVDPKYDCECRMTSDHFFHTINQHFKYDLIFIDGLHTAEQVEKDIINSLERLSPNGTIIIHDCNPQFHTKEMLDCCGEVWIVWAKLRMERADLDMRVIDIDHGVGIIRKGKQTLYQHKGEELNYSYLAEHRKQLLNLISVKEFESWV